MIPRKIHYIWFGKNEKSELIQKCISTTKKILPDWEIIEWNEDSYDIDSCDYMREAYEHKKYAFASDYARFDLLYKYGGVYLDTDVELLKRIPENMLETQGFTGFESNNKIAPGLIFSCVPGNSIVKEIIDMYQKDHFELPDGKVNTKTVVDRVTEIFEKHGLEKDGMEQILDGFHVYPVEYFCAYDFVTREFKATENTVSIHHYTATWTDSKSRIKRKFQDIIRNIFGIEFYKKIISIKRKLFGVYGE